MPRSLLHLHPVADGVGARALGLHGAGQLDGASVKQELLGERGLAGVGVGDDRERLAALDLAVKLGGGHGGARV